MDNSMKEAVKKKLHTLIGVLASMLLLTIVWYFVTVLGMVIDNFFEAIGMIMGLMISIAILVITIGIGKCASERSYLRVVYIAMVGKIGLMILRMFCRYNDRAMIATSVVLFILELATICCLAIGISKIVDEYDPVLAVKLQFLWKLYAIAWVMTAICGFLTFATNSYLFLILTGIGAIGVCVVKIINIVYYYKTSKAI